MKAQCSFLPISVFALLLFLYSNTFAQEKRSILTGSYDTDQLIDWIEEPQEWAPYPAYGNEWKDLPEKIKKAQVTLAEEELGTSIPQITASLLMEFSQNGNRSRHADIYFGRRNRLAKAVVAECTEQEGRFMEDILNLVWAICEESFWVIPAHYGGHGRTGLPETDAAYVDLFAAETGVLLAWTHYLLREKFDEISPVINQRILEEIDQRVLKVNLEDEDAWWMGYAGRSLNNWTPWICSNWLACVLLCEKDAQRKAEATYKIMECLDRFLDPYPADGGCDEGPGYWGRAGASLFECLELLEMATKGKVNVWNNQLIRNIGQYIYKVHIKDDYYVNFADASAMNNPDPALVYRYGKKIEDETMAGFGAWLANRRDLFDGNIGGNLPRKLATFDILPELKQTQPQEPFVDQSWLPDLQVLIARSKSPEGNGLFLAAKGGHNAESHNHNDIGNFIIYYDGKPVVIDVGVETYTKKTFSSQRYEIWTMQSQYHNLPTINGVMQAPGRKFAARNVACEFPKDQIVFSLDFAESYPEEAAVESWNRTLAFDRGKQTIKVTDDFVLKKSKEPTVMNFVLAEKPTIDKKKRIISLGAGDAALKMKFPKNLTASSEKIEVEDSRLGRVWGETLYRIQLTEEKTKTKGSYEFEFSK